MSSVTINIKGVKELQSKIAMFKPQVSAALTAGATTLKGKVAVYPPRTSTYVRTGKLGQSWAMSQSLNGLQVIIGNNTPYGPYVQDREMQAWMHKGIWKPVQDIAEEYGPEIVVKIKQALDML